MSRTNPFLQEVETNEELEINAQENPNVAVELDKTCPKGSSWDEDQNMCVLDVVSVDVDGEVETVDPVEDLVSVDVVEDSDVDLYEEEITTERVFQNQTFEQFKKKYKINTSDYEHLDDNIMRSLEDIQNNIHWMQGDFSPEIEQQTFVEVFKDFIDPSALNKKDRAKSNIDLSSQIGDLVNNVNSKEEMYEAMLLSDNRFSDFEEQDLIRQHAEGIDRFASNLSVSQLEAYYAYDCTFVNRGYKDGAVTDNCKNYAKERIKHADLLYDMLLHYKNTGSITNYEGDFPKLYNPTKKEGYIPQIWKSSSTGNKIPLHIADGIRKRKVDEFVRDLVKKGGYEEKEGDLQYFMEFMTDGDLNTLGNLGLAPGPTLMYFENQVRAEVANGEADSFNIMFQPKVWNTLTQERRDEVLNDYRTSLTNYYKESIQDPLFQQVLKDFNVSEDQMVEYRQMLINLTNRMDAVESDWKSNTLVLNKMVGYLYEFDGDEYEDFIEELMEGDEYFDYDKQEMVSTEMSEKEATLEYIRDKFGESEVESYKIYLETGNLPQLMMENEYTFNTFKSQAISTVKSEFAQEFGWENLRVSEDVKTLLLSSLPIGIGEGWERIRDRYLEGLEDENTFNQILSRDPRKFYAIDSNGEVVVRAADRKSQIDGAFLDSSKTNLDNGPVLMYSEEYPNGKWYIGSKYRAMGWELQDGIPYSPIFGYATTNANLATEKSGLLDEQQYRNLAEKEQEEKQQEVITAGKTLTIEKKDIERRYKEWNEKYGETYAEFYELGKEVGMLEVENGMWVVDGKPLSLAQVTYYQGVFHRLKEIEGVLEEENAHDKFQQNQKALTNNLRNNKALNDYINILYKGSSPVLIEELKKQYRLGPRLEKQLDTWFNDQMTFLTLGAWSETGFPKASRDVFEKHYPQAYKSIWGDKGLFTLNTLVDNSGTILNTAVAFLPGGMGASALMSGGQAYGGQYNSLDKVIFQATENMKMEQQMLLDNDKMSLEDWKSKYGLQKKLTPLEVSAKLRKINKLEEQSKISNVTQQFSSLFSGAQAFALERFVSLPLIKGRIPFIGKSFLVKTGDSFLLGSAKVFSGGVVGVSGEVIQENVETILENANNIIVTGDGSLLDGILATDENGEYKLDVDSQLKLLITTLTLQGPSNLGRAKNMLINQVATVKNRTKINTLVKELSQIQKDLDPKNLFDGKTNKSKLSTTELTEKAARQKEIIVELEIANNAPLIQLTYLNEQELKKVTKETATRSRKFAALYELGLSGKMDNASKAKKKKLLAEIENLTLIIDGTIENAVERSVPKSELDEKTLKDRNGETGKRAEGDFLHGLYDNAKIKAKANVQRAGGTLIEIKGSDFTQDSDGNSFKGKNDLIFSPDGKEVVGVKNYTPTNKKLFDFYTKTRKLSAEQANKKISDLFINSLNPGIYGQQDGKADIIVFEDNIFTAIYNRGDTDISLLDAEIAAVTAIHENFHVNHMQTTIQVVELDALGNEVVVEKNVSEVINTETGKNQAELAIKSLDDLMKLKRDQGKITAEVYDNFVKRREVYKDSDFEVEEIMNIIGDYVTLGHVKPGDFNLKGDFGITVKQLVNGVSNRLTGKDMFILHDFKDGNSVMQYINRFYKNFQGDKVSYKVAQEEQEKDKEKLGLKESKVAYGDQVVSLENERAQLIENFNKSKEGKSKEEIATLRDEFLNNKRYKRLNEEIKKMKGNIELSNKNEATWTVLGPLREARNKQLKKLLEEKQMLEDVGNREAELQKVIEQIKNLPKSRVYVAAENDLIEQNRGIVENFMGKWKPIGNITRSDFELEVWGKVVDIINNYNQTQLVDDGKGGKTTVDFGYYLNDRLNYQLGNILEKLTNKIKTQDLGPDTNLDDFADDDTDLGGDGLLTETAVASDLRHTIPGIDETVKKEMITKVAKRIDETGTPENKRKTRKEISDKFAEDFRLLVKDGLGTKGSDEFKVYLRANKSLLVDMIAIKYKRRFPELSYVIKKRATVEETLKLKNDPNYNGFIESTTAGNDIYGVVQFTDPDATITLADGTVVSTYMSEQDFVKVFTEGRETRYKSLVLALGSELGHDATFDAIRENDSNDIDNFLLYYTEIGKRDPNMKFSRVPFPDGYDWDNLRPSVGQIIGLTSRKTQNKPLNEIVDLDPDSPGYLTFFNSADNVKFDKAEIAVAIDIISMIDPSKIDQSIVRFKQTIINDPNTPAWQIEALKAIGNIKNNPEFRERKVEQVNNFAEKYIGNEILQILGPEIFGYINRNLDPAKTKKLKGVLLENSPKGLSEDGTNPCVWEIKSGNNEGMWGVFDIAGWTFNKESGQWTGQIPDPDNTQELKTVSSSDPISEYGAEVKSGEHYADVQDLNKRVSNVASDTEVDLNKVRLMNKGQQLFKDINDILQKGDGKGDLSRETKIKLIKKLAPEINAANIENKKLAVEIVGDMITAVANGEMDHDVFSELLQSQSGIVNGFRALSSLDFITILDGEQDLNSYGEHLQPNVKLMLGLQAVMMNNVEFDSDGNPIGLKEEADLKGDLEKVFGDLRQFLTNDLVASVMDKEGGKTWNTDLPATDRIKTLSPEDQANIFSINGKPFLEHVINIEVERVISENTAVIKQENEQLRVERDQRIVDTKIRTEQTLSGVVPGASVFDFDSTLEKGGTNIILATHPTLGEIKIPSHDFHSVVGDLTSKGYEFNFDDFANVRGSEKGLLFEKFKNQIEKYGSENVVILTARQPEAAVAIQAWLAQNGIDLPLQNITGLGGEPGVVVTGVDKANWIKENLYLQGYGDVYFVDDGQQIVKDVGDMMAKDFPHLIGKSILADPNYKKIHEKFSRGTDSETFNVFIEQVTLGEVTREQSFSAAQARLRGSQKKGFNNIIPYSAEDFRGLLYQFAGKGQDGEYQMLWLEEKLIKPYSRAEIEITKDKQRINTGYKKLLGDTPGIKKKLKTPIDRADGKPSNYTLDHAVRVYLWNKNKIEIPGISSRDLELLDNAVKSDPTLRAFADQLGVVTDQDAGYVKPGDYWTIENISSDMNDVINTISREKHLAVWKENVDQVFSKENLQKIEAVYGIKYREALENMLGRMETGHSRGKNYNQQDRVVQEWDDWNNASVGSVMFYNFRSGILQVNSMTNYLELTGPNNIKAAAEAFVNNPERWTSNFVKLWTSDYLLDRREGEKRGINEAELRAAIDKGGPKGALAYLLNLGFTPTRLADSFAICSGGASYVMNYTDHISGMFADWKASGADLTILLQSQDVFTEGDLKYNLEKLGIPLEDINTLTEEQLEDLSYKLAYEKFVEATERGQQSSRQDMLSQQQTGSLGKTLLAFKNAPMQYTRNILRAAQDIKNGRGNLAKNIGIIAHYGVIQNLMFNGMQKALFAALDEEDEEWQEKSDDVIQGMINSVIEGAGMTGAVVVTVKNGILEYNEQEAKGWNADHGYTLLQFANLSPTIGSKLRKIYGSIKGKQYNAEAIAAMDLWDIQNPAWMAVANLVSAFANIPADRVVSYLNNLLAVSADENEWWQNMALILGYNTWDLDVETKAKKINKEAKEEKVIEKKKEKIKEAQEVVDVVVEKEVKKEKEGKGEDVNTCAGVKSSGERCSIKVDKAGDKCQYHADKKEKDKMVKCSFVKPNGEQCKLPAVTDDGRCNTKQHQPGYKKK